MSDIDERYRRAMPMTDTRDATTRSDIDE